jgi:predicted metal-dependent peptidase
MTITLPASLQRARLQLMLVHPYLASALARLPIVNAEEYGWCRTMATDGYHIFVNPRFCAELTEPEILGVLAHELLHCVLGHIDRRGGRNRILWNLAIDYATNLLLRDFGFQLPRGGFLSERYRGMTSEQIYADLERLGILAPPCEGFDQHIEPGDMEGLSERSRDYPSAEERRRLRAVVLREMSEELARRRGTIPGELAREAQPAVTAEVSWRQLLARFMNGLRRSDYRLFPFNRKHLWRGIYLPSLGVPGPDHLVLAIDTSGSVSPKMLGQFLAELDRLRALTQCRLTLLQCDAAIRKVDELSGQDAALTPSDLDGKRFRLIGGGGTDFRPVFKWVAERSRQEPTQPDAVIYCTDGFGICPATKPPYPVVWVVTAKGRATFPFGLVIRLSEA